MSLLAGIVLTLFMSTTTTAQDQPSSKPAAAPQEQVTIVGCIVRESDYRRAADAGKGGVAGTGAGAGNEYILTNASMSTGASAPVATAGSAATAAYELTGSNEGQAKEFVGKRVEITGKLKPAEVGAAGPTGGPTADKPPSGVDLTSKDLKLREIEVASVKATTGTCPAQ
jgi:hypothetical protein